MTKVYTYEYDNAYNPAMPVVDIEIGRAMDAASLALKALVDSGADATIIPINSLQQIRARRSRKMWMRGTAGGRVLVDLYQISLQLGPFVQTLLEVVGSTQNDEVIVGRDVLNHLTITLNGPAHSGGCWRHRVNTTKEDLLNYRSKHRRQIKQKTSQHF